MQKNLNLQGESLPENRGIHSVEVTIGIPVYQAEKYVRQSFESALAQTFESIEILVLDDCGTDSSMDVVRHLQASHPRGSFIRIVRQPHNMGPGAARNRLIAEAAGRYIYFMDADDTIEPNTIELLYSSMQAHHAEICFGSYQRVEDFGDKATTVCQYPAMAFDSNDAFGSFAFRRYDGLQASACNFLASVDLFKSNRLWFLTGRYWDAMTMMMRLPAYVHRVVLLPDITYHYNCHFDSLSNFQRRDLIRKEEIEQIAKVVDEVKRQTVAFTQRPYYPLLLNKLLMTGFYIACNVLQNKGIIRPPFAPSELRRLMWSPASLLQIIRFKQKAFANLFLCLIGKLPSIVAIWVIRLLGRAKELIK